MRTCISYAGNATAYTHGIPIHLQRLLIQQYCADRGLEVRFEQLEIEVMPHLPILLHLVDVTRPEVIVLFSIYALPADAALRAPILDAALAHRVTLCFANEAEERAGPGDRDRLERILRFSAR